MSDIKGFFGEYRWLSNFWFAPITVSLYQYEEIPTHYFKSTFKAATNEHAYQALKCVNRQDFDNILAADKPGKAKKLGRNIAIQPTWDIHKHDIMYYINLMKYTQHATLRVKLRQTGNVYLEETNTWNDTYWGVCNGKGENRLGHILMRIREELR